MPFGRIYLKRRVWPQNLQHAPGRAIIGSKRRVPGLLVLARGPLGESPSRCDVGYCDSGVREHCHNPCGAAAKPGRAYEGYANV